MPDNDAAREALARCVPSTHGQVVAALTRRFGARHLELAENAAQEAYLRALVQWPTSGEPGDPTRWLVRVAHNWMVDTLRRHRIERLLDFDVAATDMPGPTSEDEVRLIFLCCDPVLSRAAQISLVLNLAFGLTARQIAVAFVSDERAVAQRIVRAKQALRDHGIRFDMPSHDTLSDRLNAILDVLYLVFSEGYHPTDSAEALDLGLCSEALRLLRLLTGDIATAHPAACALRATMCFHVSRLPGRLADDGSLLLLPEQDRSRWDHALIAEAFECLKRAGSGSEVTRFHVEAGVAACHAVAPTFAATDWAEVVELYDVLRAKTPSLVVEVNRAIAVAMHRGARAGLDELDAIPEREVLGRYPFALAAYADLHASLGEVCAARSYLDVAIAHQRSSAQLSLLRRKRATLDAWSPEVSQHR